jgi:REP element-mobilizing transposase RayT
MLLCPENMRRRFALRIYGYVVMPEHVHLLINEPEKATIAEAMHFLKLSFAKRLRSRSVAAESGSFSQKRYRDRNVRDAREFTVKLRYLHRNPVRRDLVKPETGNGAAFATMRCEKSESSRSNPNGQPEIGKQKPAAARRERSSTQVSVQSADANLGHQAISRMSRALEMFMIEGIYTTIPLHRKILADPDFRAGKIDTTFIERFLAKNGIGKPAA